MKRAVRYGAGIGSIMLVLWAVAQPENDGAEPSAEDKSRKAAVEKMFRGYQKQFKDVPVVSVKEAREKARKGEVLLIDAREPDEQAISMIPGAMRAQAFNSDQPTTQPVVAYCTIGYRSAEYARMLRLKGWTAANLEGGILGWVHGGGTVVDESGTTTQRLHVYGKRWDLAPQRYETVYPKK